MGIVLEFVRIECSGVGMLGMGQFCGIYGWGWDCIRSCEYRVAIVLGLLGMGTAIGLAEGAALELVGPAGLL